MDGGLGEDTAAEVGGVHLAHGFLEASACEYGRWNIGRWDIYWVGNLQHICVGGEWRRSWELWLDIFQRAFNLYTLVERSHAMLIRVENQPLVVYPPPAVEVTLSFCLILGQIDHQSFFLLFW